MTRYIDCTETAVMIRQELKDVFPGMKFSVRKSSYVNGSSICVKWTDGPTRAKVQDVVNVFKGVRFNASFDSTEYVNTIYKGEEVHFEASVYCERVESRAFIEQLVAQYYKDFGRDVPFRIEFRGADESPYVDGRHLSAGQLYWFRAARENTDADSMPKAKKKYKTTYKSKATKAKESYEVYRKQYEREQEERERAYVKREQDRLDAEHARQQEEEREQARKRREARRSSPKGFTQAEALNFFGLKSGATIAEVKAAFRKIVREAADGHGGYKRDMDVVTKFKEVLGA